MKKLKCISAVILSLAVLVSMFSISGAMSVAGAGADFEIIELRTNNETYPVIDGTPSFSWKMSAAAFAKTQTAYQIIVKCGADTVWDSGKVDRDISVGIPYEGPQLAASSVYSWMVSVWDNSGASVTSPPAEFETGLGSDDSAWSGSSWITEKAATSGESDVISTPEGMHYTVEADILIDGTTAVGIVFNASYEETNRFLMWQIQTSGNAVNLRPHRYNGSWLTLQTINISNVVPGLTAESLKTTPIHMKIDVTASVITTYINDILVNTREFPNTNPPIIPHIGAIGAHSGGNEGGMVDNLRLVDYTADAENGEVVYSYDFGGDDNPLSYNALNGNEVASVENGCLKMFGSGVALPPVSGSAMLHYVVEADVAVEKQAVGVIFNYQDNRNMLMWQINTANAGQVMIRPHNRINGTWSAVSSFAVNVPGVTNNNGKTDMLHLKIDVTKSVIKTYINGTQVDSRPTASMGIPPVLGLVGGHSGGNEGGYIDNLLLTDYTEDKSAGNVIYSFNFDDGVNPLTGDPQSNSEPALVVDGKLYQNGNKWSLPIDSMKSPFPAFRKKIEINGEVEWARLYTTALGAFDMYIDGQRVGTETDDGIVYDELKPGYTTQSKRIHYYTYDVTSALKENQTHLIAAQLAKGWYGGLSGGVTSTLALRSKLLVKYSGQDEPVIVGTDDSWKTDYAGGFMYASIYDGETYDGNAGNAWRSEPEFDDSSWGTAGIKTDWNGVIDPISGSRVQLRRDLTREKYTVTVYDGASGEADDRFGKINAVGTYSQDDSFILHKGETAVIDFEQNFAGWPEITASGAQGTTILMRTGEMLNDNDGIKSRGNDGPEGSVHHANYRTAASTARYIMNGGGDETYHSTYTFYGFRYIELTASDDITVKGMRGLVLTSMLEDTGLIETSDPDVNKLFSNIKWGGYSNLLSVPTDCPQRNERSGWAADTHVFSTTGLYYADLQNFYMKWMDDMRDSARSSDGAFRTIAPINETEGYEAGWSDAGVIVPYNVYKMTGDKRVLEENWDAMQKFMDVYMASTDKNGGGTRYGDWVALENNEEDVKRLCAIAYYAGDALMMAEMADALGKPADAEKYRGVYEIEKAYFQEKYVNPDGSLKRGEQTSCLMALAYDLLPNEESVEKVKATLLANLESHGNHLQTGFLGTAIIMQTLTEIGAADMAYNLLLQHEFPSWLYCVDLGATTTWERWNSYTEEDGFAYKRMNSNDPANMNSFNHYAYGAVAEWMYSYMAGIMYDTDNPGFKHFILQPTPDVSGRITSVNGSYNSPYGLISSSWRYDGDRFIYDATIPANTSATVEVPLEAGKTILVNGKTAESLKRESDGIEYLKTENGIAVFEAGSGSYTFSVGHLPLKGDVDGNGELNVSDVVLLRQIIMKNEYTDDQLFAGDLDDNRSLNVSDVVALRQKIMAADLTA